MSGQNWPHVLNLSNSIIGVTVLAMPFCYKECGIILGTTLLFFSTWLTLTSCQMLMRAGVTSRKRSYGFLAHYTHGAPGKIAVEVGMIGLQIGTLIAQVVIIGDLGPAIVSKWTGLQNTGHLRTALIVVLCLCVGLPLGLLRNLTAVSRASTLCIIFYSMFVLYVMSLSIPNLKAANWFDKVNLWRTDGLFKCLPIFSFAFGCQTQLFILYDALPEPSLKEIKSITSSAVHMCTVAYLLVGFFGYIAFCDKDIGGDIITQFTETYTSDLLKVGFVMSIAITFPLIIFPCRGSLYTLLFPQRQKHHEDIESRPVIPEIHFKALTVAIVAVAMVTGILVPNVEFVLAMNGATMGTLICYIFPAIFFLRVMTGSSGKNLAQLVLIIGLTIMFLCTYTTLNSQEHVKPQPIEVPKAVTKAPHKADQAAAPPGKDVAVEKKDVEDTAKEKKPPDLKESKKDDTKEGDDKRVEPPNPKPPDEKVVEKNESHLDKAVEVPKEDKHPVKKDTENTGKVEEKMKGKKNKKELETKEKKESTADKEKKSAVAKEDEKKSTKEETKDEKKEEAPSKDKDTKKEEEKGEKKDGKNEEKELIKELKKQQAEQKKLIQEQKEILNELKQHKQLEHDNQQILNEIMNDDVQNEEIDGQQPGPVKQQQQPGHLNSQGQHHQQPVRAGQAQQQGFLNQQQVVGQQQIGVGNQQPVVVQQQNLGQQQMGAGNQQPVAGQQENLGQQQLGAGNQQVVGQQQNLGQQQMGAGNQQVVGQQQNLGQQQIGVGNQQQFVGQQQVVGQQQIGGVQQAGGQQQIVGQQQIGAGNEQLGQQSGVNYQQQLGNQQFMNQQQGGIGNVQQVQDQQQILNQQVGQGDIQQQNLNQQQFGIMNQQQNAGVNQPVKQPAANQQSKEGFGQQPVPNQGGFQQPLAKQQEVVQQPMVQIPAGAARKDPVAAPQLHPHEGKEKASKLEGGKESINQANQQGDLDTLKRGKRNVSPADSTKDVKEKTLKQEAGKIDSLQEKRKKPGFDEMRRKKLSVEDGNDIVGDIGVKEALDSLTRLVSPVPHLNGGMRSLKSLEKEYKRRT